MTLLASCHQTRIFSHGSRLKTPYGWFPHRNSSSMMSADHFLASLSPMKRLLCLCPVPVSYFQSHKGNSRTGDSVYFIGAAVSDPYLAYAKPIKLKNEMIEARKEDLSGHCTTGSFPTLTVFNNELDSPIRVEWQGLPTSFDHFLDQIEYRDIGGILYGLPLLYEKENRFQNGVESVKWKVIQNIIMRYHLDHWNDDLHEREGTKEHEQNVSKQNDNPIYLQYSIDEHISLTEALKMVKDEPEMWEEIDLSEQLENLEPDVHAATVLNTFLWKYTGGWRNTFA